MRVLGLAALAEAAVMEVRWLPDLATEAKAELLALGAKSAHLR